MNILQLPAKTTLIRVRSPLIESPVTKLGLSVVCHYNNSILVYNYNYHNNVRELGLFLPVMASSVQQHRHYSTAVLSSMIRKALSTNHSSNCRRTCNATACRSPHSQHRRWRHITQKRLNQNQLTWIWAGKGSLNQNNVKSNDLHYSWVVRNTMAVTGKYLRRD